MENAIVVDNVHIGYQSIKTVESRFRFGLRRSKLEKFEAVRGVSFQVEEGAIVGLIGKNGSGKSTLLRAIAGIFAPNEGTIDVGSRRVALLSLGVGFQAKLSGRDNIILSGLLMGFTKKQILEQMDSIIEFSELGSKIDMPVQTYSSGMFSKLAFSITANLDSEIVLIDEVLSVGDERFKEKSFAKMQELISDKQRTVIIVSHSMDTVKNLCSSVIWLHEGQIVKTGEVADVVPEYVAFMKKKK